ncbi:P2 family phage major capsid protein, partial [Escherichia coli]|uniref:P2 family phage major capsid protein n=2 Tax=Pseudomonadota TaxID=1224 RepID=UPI001561846A
AILVTSWSNLSIYYQEGGRRRSILDNPKRDRVETYESSNDAFVIEDLGKAVLIENIEQEPEA